MVGSAVSYMICCGASEQDVRYADGGNILMPAHQDFLVAASNSDESRPMPAEDRCHRRGDRQPSRAEARYDPVGSGREPSYLCLGWPEAS